MAASPPRSPSGLPTRPMSAIVRPAPRSQSRMSMTGKIGGGVGLGGGGVGGAGGSRASDEDGKTSVRVAIRVRPPLQATDPGYDLIPQRFQRSMVEVTSPTSLVVDSPQGRRYFFFDRVFGEDVTQAGVWDYLVESVGSFVQGYNVSMLAYGQSGAGKSYTMGTSGPSEQDDTEAMGVIPRAALILFEKLEGPRQNNNRSSMSGLRAPTRYAANQAAHQTKAADRSWSLKATYVEIYNEQLRDLLVPEGHLTQERGQVAIREDTKGQIILTGLHQLEINSVEDLLAALNFGSSIRQTDSTAINAKSSRSHAVFSLNLIQRKSKLQTAQGNEKRFSVPVDAGETMVTIDSKLHFVDLAGSERLKKTGAQGERAREGININAGLQSLGKVISQLSSRQAGSHVSYRDSKLTRLLQDSLGGNAITYMIACVTPAEFHLSETLNTVQYAQRARQIQSKPRIQQISDEHDSKALTVLIERLKTEVNFLREQISRADRGEEVRTPRTNALMDRSDRSNEREVELQNQLLDTQESYSSLSQRHAKLITEMARARDSELIENTAQEHLGMDNATERLQRSNNFAEAVDQVVIEYEKTIQSLEQSLISTRSSLSNAESTLLEKETNCAVMERLNQQLQSRLSKLIDRESSTEHYLHDLEAKLYGHASGEEKNSAIITELKKEIARARENEASCEDYISTLEERLSESTQDAELLQREIARLEELNARRMNVGKLDSLLYDLDTYQKDKPADAEEHSVNGKLEELSHSRKESLASRRGVKDVILENGEDDHGTSTDETPATFENLSRSAIDGPVDNGQPIEEAAEEPQLALAHKDVENLGLPDASGYSPVQSRFMADKLENMTHELFELRDQHENTVTENELLRARLEEAQRELSEVRDAVDEARLHRLDRDSLQSVSTPMTVISPASFLAEARMSELKDGEQLSSSRSLSSELSSAGELANNIEGSDVGIADKRLHQGESLEVEVEALKKLAAEREEAQKLLNERYEQLHEQHLETLDVVEELKTEVQKAKMNGPTSPRAMSPVIRRKSSQNVLGIDRAHRAFASLRNIATENFEGQLDVMQNFELNLHTAMHELHLRSERVQELEADIGAVKKEMEMKMTIITGLTRERSSLKNTSPIDMSLVSTMQDQLLQSENQIRLLRNSHDSREQELLAKIDSLQASNISPSSEPKLETREINGAHSEAPTEIETQRIAELQSEIERLKTSHQDERMADALKTKANGEQSNEKFDQYRAQQQERIDGLQNEIDNHKASAIANATRVAELEQTHDRIREQLDEATRLRDASNAELGQHKNLMARLEEQIAEHEAIVKTHQHGLSLLHENHAREIESVTGSMQSDHEARLNQLMDEHSENVHLLEAELGDARDDLMKIATQVAFAMGLDVSTDKLQERISDLLEAQKALADEQQKGIEAKGHFDELSSTSRAVTDELENVKKQLSTLHDQSAEAAQKATEHIAMLENEKNDFEKKNKKNSRLVSELEDQLASNYDQHQMANNRLSTLQTERNAQLDEVRATNIRLQSELDTIKEEFAAIQAKQEASSLVEGNVARRSSVTTQNLRKSTSIASLPSPPPAIPLPPLPNNVGPNASPTLENAASVPVPATPGLGRLTSKEMELIVTQVNEDHEARIRSLEKHLSAERQLTQTLEEALTDLEQQTKLVKQDGEAWRKRAAELEREVHNLKEKPVKEDRWSIHAVEEERKKRIDAEVSAQKLKERMALIDSKKKKKGSLNCF